MTKEKFDRGSALTIFKSDRTEDMAALVIAFGIAFLVYVIVGG
ncbi:MAG: hypothetical protein OEN49_05905 [Gammaproteobacteria bacterium]|nr:hypothetical protein [Gammaproteobacteria bacterium]